MIKLTTKVEQCPGCKTARGNTVTMVICCVVDTETRYTVATAAVACVKLGTTVN